MQRSRTQLPLNFHKSQGSTLGKVGSDLRTALFFRVLLVFLSRKLKGSPLKNTRSTLKYSAVRKYDPTRSIDVGKEETCAGIANVALSRVKSSDGSLYDENKDTIDGSAYQRGCAHDRNLF